MRLGPYEVQGEIGRGGTGVVLRGVSPSGDVVAIKLLRRLESQDARARFERERRILASLGADEGFVPLLDAGETKDGPYLVMPLLGAGTLRGRLDRGPLPIPEAVSLVAALARSVGAAHERHIVHRDLKPENVLFLGTKPLIADLGLAKHLREGAAASVGALSRDGEMRGTAGYMAPEQMESAREARPSADVFALGAILYECLSGRPAFRGDTVVELLARVQACEV